MDFAKTTTRTPHSYKIIDELLFNLDKNKVSGMILVDYSKAFDMVDHALLLDKLKLYDVAGESIEWFQSYLAVRQQLVAMGGCVSDMVVPQI